MIFNQIRRIGEVELGNKGEYEILVDMQKHYARKYLLIISLTLDDNNFYQINIFEQEYEVNYRYSYGSGLTGGNSLCLSPCVSIKWPDLKNEEEYQKNLFKDTKIVNLTDKLVKMKNHPFMTDYKDTVVESFYEWIDTNHRELRLKIAEYLFSTYIQGRRPKNEKPSMIVFKINDNFPGDYPEFRKLYVELSLGKTSNNDQTDEYCYICGKIGSISDSSIFNLGLFTLDHPGFGLHFRKKKDRHTLRICQNCDLKLRRGYNILENDLRFYAYSIGKGRNQEQIYHYLIPLVTNPDLLRKALLQLRRAKQKLNAQRAHDLEENIKNLELQLQRADRDQRQSLKGQLKDLKGKWQRYSKNIADDVEIADLFVELGVVNGIAYLDLYFKETDKKQNPPTKEIVNIFHIKKKRFEKLAKTFGTIKTDHNLSSLQLWHLKNLIDENKFPFYLQAIFGETKLDKKVFLKNSNSVLKQAFLADLLEYDNLYFRSKLRDFRIFYQLLDDIDIWRN